MVKKNNNSWNSDWVRTHTCIWNSSVSSSVTPSAINRSTDFNKILYGKLYSSITDLYVNGAANKNQCVLVLVYIAGNYQIYSCCYHIIITATWKFQNYNVFSRRIFQQPVRDRFPVRTMKLLNTHTFFTGSIIIS